MHADSQLIRKLQHAALLALVFISGCERVGQLENLSRVPVGSVQSELRIGSVDDPEYAFGHVAALEIGSDGSIYSLHPQESAVRHWSREGRALGVIGRRGEGPGEFMTPYQLGWRGDSLWVFDRARNSRITFFDPGGAYLADITPMVDLGSLEQAEAGIFPPRPFGLLGDGSLYGMTLGISREIIQGRQRQIAHVRMNHDGAVLNTIASLPIGTETVLGILGAGGGMYTTQPFGDGVLSVLTRDGQALLVLERPASAQPNRAEFRLHRIELNGDTAWTRAYPYVPLAIPRDSIEATIRAQAERFYSFAGRRTGTTEEQSRGWVREATYVPAYYPPVSQLVAGRDGTVWLALNPAGESGLEWMVLDAMGKVIAKTQTPSALRVLMPELAAIWGVETDDLGVEFIVRYAVRMPS